MLSFVKASSARTADGFGNLLCVHIVDRHLPACHAENAPAIKPFRAPAQITMRGEAGAVRVNGDGGNKLAALQSK